MTWIGRHFAALLFLHSASLLNFPVTYFKLKTELSYRMKWIGTFVNLSCFLSCPQKIAWYLNFKGNLLIDGVEISRKQPFKRDMDDLNRLERKMFCPKNREWIYCKMKLYLCSYFKTYFRESFVKRDLVFNWLGKGLKNEIHYFFFLRAVLLFQRRTADLWRGAGGRVYGVGE